MVSAQEVTAGAINLCRDKNLDVFEFLKQELSLDGAYHHDIQYIDDPGARFGNAVLTKFPVKNKKVLTLKGFKPLTFEEIDGASAFEIRPQLPRHLLDTIIEIEGREVHAMSWHGAWTAPPTDTDETLRQAKVVADYLKSLSGPFILGGDLNNVSGSKTVRLIGEVAINWMKDSGAVQTTHPKIHKIVPKGFLVDYIFSSRHFNLLSISVPEVLVSDHLPVVAEFEF